MREIEFRAKKLESGKWVFGYYHKLNESFENKDCILEHHRNTSTIIDIKTLSQYTGLKDKNGTKIFEGDIVKVDNKHIDIVVYASGCFCMDRQIMNYEFTYQNFKSIEVIGNIYDNPELVEKVEG